MYRQGRAAAAAASRLRPAAPLRSWPQDGASATGPEPPRRRYRARPQDPEPRRCLLPPPAPGCCPPPPRGRFPPPPHLPPALSLPEGMGGDITTVDGTREDDITVWDPLPSPSAALLLLLLRPQTPCLAPAGPPPPSKPPPPSMEEHLAAMHQKLQHELPNFFFKVHDYGLYSPDVEFIHPGLRLHTRGRPLYALALGLCRALAWGYLASPRLELLALTRHPEDWSLRARWRLTGLPLHLCLLRPAPRHRSQLLRSYDALSTFFLNSQGLIRCHRVDKLMPAPTALPQPKKLLVAAAAAALADPAPSLGLALKPGGT